MSDTPHRWIRAAHHRDRLRLLDSDLGAPALARLDAHRNLRGPYTAAGALLREIVPAILARRPDLVHRHEIEILSIAPELRDVVPVTRETLTSLAIPGERTRFYSRLRTLRHAHGVAELVNAWLADLDEPRTLLVNNVHQADPTDQELFAVLLRRADPARLCLRLATGIEPMDEPIGRVAVPLSAALRRHAVPVEAVAAAPAQDATAVPAQDATAAAGGSAASAALAREYVCSDCVDDDPALYAAYAGLEPDARAALHDERADELLARDEWSLRLGAVALHRERGADPAGAGADALREPLEYCVNMGFYHASIDYGHRGRAVIDPTAQLEHWWAFTTKATTSLLALGLPLDALALYDEARAHTTAPMVHMQSAYATSMIYTRHLEKDERDHRRARAWGNAAIAYAGLLPESLDRSAHLVFNRNGLALVAMHEGRLDEALELVEQGIVELDRALGPDEHQLHRSVLRHNRSQLLNALGRREEALAELDAVIAADPNYPEYHLDRGNLLRRLGRPAEALEHYDRASRLSPPFTEVHYNRADTLLELGEVEAALDGFDYVLDLDPEHLDARINRAGLRYALDDLDGAWTDVRLGLAADPDNAHLLCVRGQLELDDDPRAAHATLTAAVAGAPELAAAWSARGLAAHRTGDLPAALADLGRALDLEDSPVTRFNRAMVLMDAGRHEPALADLTLAAEADDDPETWQQRDLCLQALGRA
ncbi:tetratricopeptide repeat protein [Plantactinospora sp. KBS50]|uniref:tetratricopeptide repeat protein n=1 Tax=Plantactinospora sp. KBS50 TaxID=2024580 RepID=UPI000BAA98D4|nr:tetratricopeptide repeat protein [Plantactinospora sp. KBS50]ASW55430.1 hypothetical protein CIK06_16520 [Plantactinospora sp. KBS50]